MPRRGCGRGAADRDPDVVAAGTSRRIDEADPAWRAAVAAPRELGLDPAGGLGHRAVVAVRWPVRSRRGHRRMGRSRLRGHRERRIGWCDRLRRIGPRRHRRCRLRAVALAWLRRACDGWRFRLPGRRVELHERAGGDLDRDALDAAVPVREHQLVAAGIDDHVLRRIDRGAVARHGDLRTGRGPDPHAADAGPQLDDRLGRLLALLLGARRRGAGRRSLASGQTDGQPSRPGPGSRTPPAHGAPAVGKTCISGRVARCHALDTSDGGDRPTGICTGSRPVASCGMLRG